jgi:ABC-type enterochelin transport system permease subunit
MRILTVLAAACGTVVFLTLEAVFLTALCSPKNTPQDVLILAVCASMIAIVYGGYFVAPRKR